MARPRFVFISYNHDDRPWLDLVRKAFAARAESDLNDIIWCDLEQKPATQWRQTILDAIAKASVGLLIVSKNFHASSFIRDVELPELEDAFNKGRLLVTWVRVDEVDYNLTWY